MRKRLKVLVLAQYFFPDMGGGSTRATNVVKGLLQNSCEVTVVAAFPHYPHGKVPASYRGKAIVSEKFGSAQVYRVWIPALPHSSSLKRVILHLCFIFSSLFALPFVGKTDVVWGANPNLFSFFPSLFYGAMKHVPIVRNVDDLWPEVFYELGYVQSKFVQKTLNFLAWLSYTVPVAVTPISDGYKRNIVDKYGISPHKIHVIEVGVESVVPTIDHKISNRFSVMYSGVLGIGYDFEIVLEAAKILDNNGHIIFAIRGIGELANKLRNEINNRGLENVILDNRFLPKEDLEVMLSSADAFILPMAGLGFVDLGLPTKVFEYQAFGKPIICVSSGEAARYVEATLSGLTVKPRDAQGLADTVLRLCSDRQLSAELGKNGRKYVSDHLTAEKIGKQFCEVFVLVCGLR